MRKLLAAGSFIAGVVMANWLTSTYGMVSLGLGLMVAAGTFAADLVLLLRDVVNSLRRLDLARDIGCHSADGTYLAFGPDQNLPKLLAWLRQVNGQERLCNEWESN